MNEASNRYETIFIMTPVLSDEQLKEASDKYRGILKKGKAEIVLDQKWGLRKLAYPIEKKSTGFYYLLEYNAPGAVIAELETELKRDERVLRFLTVRLDKHAITYNERKKLKQGKKAAEGKKAEVQQES